MYFGIATNTSLHVVFYHDTAPFLTLSIYDVAVAVSHTLVVLFRGRRVMLGAGRLLIAHFP